jgi:hypothetical protein
MKCPVCKNVFLEDRNLLGNFHVLGCSQCRGYWIRYDDYWNWFTSDSGQETFQDNLTESGAYLPSLESKQAKLCPDCGRILIKYRVDPGWTFTWITAATATVYGLTIMNGSFYCIIICTTRCISSSPTPAEKTTC